MAYFDEYHGPASISRRPSFGGGVPFPSYNDPYDQFGHGYEVSGTPARQASALDGRHNTQSFGDERYPPFPSRRNSMRSMRQHSPFEDSPLQDAYYPVEDSFTRSRSMSNAGYYPPAQPGGMMVLPPQQLSSYPSHYSSKSLMRRSSSHGPYGGIDGYARPIKFRVRHGWRNGVSLAEALGGVKLDDAHDYTFDDLNVDSSGRMLLRVRWAGYRSLTYEIPVSGFDGRVHLQSLARRIARSVEHFLTSNYISIAFDRVILHRLEETSYGTWTPILTTS